MDRNIGRIYESIGKNVTISLDEDLLQAGRRYAKLQGTSINEMFREFHRGESRRTDGE